MNGGARLRRALILSTRDQGSTESRPTRFMGSLRGPCPRIGTMNQIGAPPCPLPAKRGEGGRRPGEGRFMGRFLEKFRALNP